MQMTILAIDDDPAQLALLQLFCSEMEYPEIEYLSAETASAGFALIRDRVIDLVLSDLRLPDGSGMDILVRTKELNPLIPVVIMTAYSDPREAAALLKGGADDYLVKPTSAEEIQRLILRVHEKNVLIRESFLSPQEGRDAPKMPGVIYKSKAMAQVMRTASRCSDSSATVLLAGESGTGKELVARYIHQKGVRRGKPFVAVNISALPESLAESELFGHRRGSFTGADSDRIGRFEDADGGILFIDEIGDVAAPLQVKLLRAIQFGVIERVGENSPRKLDVRIIAASNRDLAELVAEGKFRKDLYYRLNVINIELPPLRDRKEDIRILVDHFIASFNERNERTVKGLSREAMDALMKYSFPGNVRELENLIERAVVLCAGDLILSRDLPALSPASVTPPRKRNAPYEESMRAFELGLLNEALGASGGNKSKAARALGITERHLRSRLERLESGDSAS